MKIKSGKVYLIGAGPGNPELITEMGKRLLSSVDVVVYDDLAPYELVAELSPVIERRYVGKRSSRHSMPQEEITALIVTLAKEGKSVARLKGGDPFIFGRGGEEAEELRKQGIAYEVVPGVTAMNAAAAGAGIPVTDRRFASWVTMLTGHEAISASPAVNWEDIGSLFNGTLAIYMGVKNLPNIVNGLIDGGMSEEEPCAIVIDGYKPAQAVITGTLKTIVENGKKQGLRSPAIIIIGKAAEYHARLKWREGGTLFGKRVLVTRPRADSGEFCRQLRERGAQPIPLPTIDFMPIDIKDKSALQSIAGEQTWLVFTSATGVRYFHEELSHGGYDNRFYGRAKFACIGSGTAAALKEFGFKADFMPGSSTISAFAKELKEVVSKSQYTKVLRIRGNLSDASIEKALRESGLEVTPLTVYETKVAKWEDHWRNQIVSNPPDATIFTSGSTFRGLIDILGEAAVLQMSRSTDFVSIGPATSTLIREMGMEPTVEAAVHNVSGIIDAMESYYR